jgi:hypothetical protein
MRIGASFARIPPSLAFWALVGVALFVSHDAIFLVQVGPGESLARALRGAGHDYWEASSLALVVIGLLGAAAASLRLWSLRRRAATLGAAPHRPGLRGLGAVWLRLFAVVVIGFAVQENIEHYFSHLHAPGLAVLLGPEYPLALPVIGLITGMAAVAAAAFRGAEAELQAAIASALRRTFGHAPRSLPRPPARLWVVRISPLARSIAGRAPPSRFVQHG